MKYQCITCSITGEENFYKSAAYQCKKCWNKRTIKTTKDKIQSLKNEYGGKCSKCGYNKCFDALEFHHLDPSIKEFSFGHRRGLNIDALRKELNKCILVCSNCHVEIHAALKK